MPLINTFAAASARAFGFGSEDTFGELQYTIPGTYSFLVPANVFSISAVTIGGGGGGGQALRYTTTTDPSSLITVSGGAGSNVYGGGGGALAYANNIVVTPGEILTVVVGVNGSADLLSATPGSGYGTAGGDSYVRRSSTDLVRAGGGAGGLTGAGGTVIVGTGFAGGAGGRTAWDNNYGVFAAGGAGGGAAGYTGVGGSGGQAGQNGQNGTSGSGGGGGGGGGGGLAQVTLGSSSPSFYAVYQGGAGGGGVGLNGLGISGAGGAGMPAAYALSYTPALGGGGGSGGAEGVPSGSGIISAPGEGALYGGGGGAGGSRYFEDLTNPSNKRYVGNTAGNGRWGAVRIIWSTNPGITRAFPSTNAGQL